MVFKRRRAYSRRPVRRYARSRPYKRTYRARSRKLYSRSGKNLNAIIEVKNLDQRCYQPVSFQVQAGPFLSTYGTYACFPTAIFTGANYAAFTAAGTGSWVGTSVGVGMNQREGRKINLNRFLAKYCIHYDEALRVGAWASQRDLGFGLFVNVALVLDTANNSSAAPSLQDVFITGQTSTDAIGIHRSFALPNPQGVNRFKILKHRVHRLEFATTGATWAGNVPTTDLRDLITAIRPVMGSFNVDLKGLPVTYSTSVPPSSPADARLEQIADNALHIMAWGSTYSNHEFSNVMIEIFGRTIFTG